jgi:hypothetical protein
MRIETSRFKTTQSRADDSLIRGGFDWVCDSIFSSGIEHRRRHVGADGLH